ncbi:hypothetical protein M0804_002976 [Polistes exclamans]|nr:hypothetical protein M0804_002976 [Polistes exclamans]
MLVAVAAAVEVVFAIPVADRHLHLHVRSVCCSKDKKTWIKKKAVFMAVAEAASVAMVVAVGSAVLFEIAEAIEVAFAIEVKSTLGVAFAVFLAGR